MLKKHYTLLHIIPKVESAHASIKVPHLHCHGNVDKSKPINVRLTLWCRVYKLDTLLFHPHFLLEVVNIRAHFLYIFNTQVRLLLLFWLMVCLSGFKKHSFSLFHKSFFYKLVYVYFKECIVLGVFRVEFI